MSSVALNEITDVRDGTHDTPTKLSRGIKLITSRQLKNNQILLTDYFISDEDAQKVNQRSKVDKWDILITMIGTVGDLHLVRETPDYVIKNIGLIKTAENETLAKYIFYYLQSHEGQAEIKARMSGTSQQFISLSNLRALKVNLPSPEKTQAIVDKLDVYNCLIENNSKRIEKLESMAQLLYRHYFETPETDDWEIVKIGDILGKAPSSAKLQKSEYLDVGTYPVIDQGKEYIAGFTNKLEAVIADKLPLTVFGDHTRAVKLAQDPFARGADGTQIVVSDILPPYYLYLTIKHLPLSNEHYARHFKLLKVTEIALPPENVLSKFEIEVEPIFKLINTLTKRNRSLSKARDMLLPRLMSGEIEV